MFHQSWIDFLGQIESARKTLGFKVHEEIFYRGHTDCDYKLLPGIFRHLGKQHTVKDLLKFEEDMFFEFRSRAKEVHRGNLTDWDILFYMQHHGVNTRLLDWTESFGVALYFAMLNYKKGEKQPCIWILNPYKLNETYLEKNNRELYSPENLDSINKKSKRRYSYSDFLLPSHPEAKIWWKEPLAIYPIRRVDRLTTQAGYFTIQGTDVRPLEDIVPAESEILKKIELPFEATKSAMRFLEHAGINHYTMFPDLDGLSAYLNEKYFKQKVV